MTQRIPQPPSKRPETETPTIIENPNDPQNEQREKHKKMERMANRAAKRATDTEKLYDQDHPIISGSN